MRARPQGAKQLERRGRVRSYRPLLKQLDALAAEAERQRARAERAEQPKQKQQPRWWHPKKEWPTPTADEIAAAVEIMVADPVDGPGRVSGEWIDRFGMDGLSPLVAAWKARLTGS